MASPRLPIKLLYCRAKLLAESWAAACDGSEASCTENGVAGAAFATGAAGAGAGAGAGADATCVFAACSTGFTILSG